jgi:signal transduction histidine kinase
MAKNDLYLLSFIFTVIAACFLWGLAIVVYRNNKKEYLNKTLALAMIFMGLWLLSGFVEKVISNPSDTFILWTFRWAYASGILASILFLLFALGLCLGHAPKGKIYYPVILMGIFTAGLACSTLVVKSASYKEGLLKSQNGPLFPLVWVLILFPILISIYLIFKAWTNSTGIDRARTSIILLGIVVLFPIVAICGFILPPLIGNDTSAAYATLAGVIPVILTSYAIIRLHLLDVRIILRKTSVFILGTMILSIPLIALFLILGALHLNPFVEKILVFILFIVLIFFAPGIWQRIQRWASRLFFSELYDELQLLDVVSHKLTSQNNLQSGVLSALSEMVSPLGLKSLGVVIPPSVINEDAWHFECSLGDKGGISSSNESKFNYPNWLSDISSPVVTEKLQRWPRDGQEERLAINLTENGFAACIPIKASTEKVGYYLVGEKVSRKALSSTDISLLEKSAEHVGLYIDNYALSAQLSSQLKELRTVYLNLHDAFDFKSEIIDITSHEFRTPVTLISGFAQTLIERWDQLKEEEKLSLLKDVINASDRITSLTEQFFSVSNLQEGRLSVEKVPIQLSDILQSLCSSLLPDEQERLIIEAESSIHIFTDPKHLNVVLKNVVENALRFSPADKPVIIRAWRNSINDYIQIKDLGSGIPSEEREKIFEPFVRLESLNHHSKGMGLGLYIVRLLSSRLGIEVEIDSSEGIGTTVTLIIGLNHGFTSSILQDSLSKTGL